MFWDFLPLLWFYTLALSWHWSVLFWPLTSHTGQQAQLLRITLFFSRFFFPWTCITSLVVCHNFTLGCLWLHRMGYVCVCINININICIYIERERAREQVREREIRQIFLDLFLSLSAWNATLQLRIQLISYSTWKILFILQGIIY